MFRSVDNGYEDDGYCYIIFLNWDFLIKFWLMYGKR